LVIWLLADLLASTILLNFLIYVTEGFIGQYNFVRISWFTLLRDFSVSIYWPIIPPVITEGKIPQQCFVSSPTTLLRENSASNITEAHITEGLKSASNAYYWGIFCIIGGLFPPLKTKILVVLVETTTSVETILLTTLLLENGYVDLPNLVIND